jgi:DNA-binding transcriptional regulator YiaG
MQDEQNDSSSGVLKVVGIGCLILILVPGLLGVGLWQVLRASGGLEGLIKKGGGKAIELVITETTAVMLEEMQIPEADRDAILDSLEGLGDRIANERYRRCLTQVQLARLLNVHPMSVSCWERNVKIPRQGITRMMILAFAGDPEARRQLKHMAAFVLEDR